MRCTWCGKRVWSGWQLLRVLSHPKCLADRLKYPALAARVDARRAEKEEAEAGLKHTAGEKSAKLKFRWL